MRDVHEDILAAMAAGKAVARDFLWIVAKDRSTGDPESMGLWSGMGPFTGDMIDGFTGSIEARSFHGSGGLLEVQDVPLTSDLSVRAVDIVASQIDENIAQAVRQYDARFAPVQIGRGWFNPDTNNLIQQIVPRFVGFVEGQPIVTPKAGEDGSIRLRCVSHTVELTRASTEMRSEESQRRRSATDNFYQDVGTVGEWEIRWGQKVGRVGQSSNNNGRRGQGLGLN